MWIVELCNWFAIKSVENNCRTKLEILTLIHELLQKLNTALYRSSGRHLPRHPASR